MVTSGFIWNACLPSFAKPRREAADRPQPTENPEEGSGTVLAVGIIAALLILATVIIGFAGVSMANRRAAQAADLAALAAADALRGITPGDPCGGMRPSRPPRNRGYSGEFYRTRTVCFPRRCARYIACRGTSSGLWGGCTR